MTAEGPSVDAAATPGRAGAGAGRRWPSPRRCRHSPRCRSSRTGGAAPGRACESRSTARRPRVRCPGDNVRDRDCADRRPRVSGAAAATASARRAISGLGEPGAARHLLDGGAVEVAGGEIHLAEGAAGAQDLVDRAHRLEELRPVDVGDQAHAGDDVADRDVGRALELVLLAHQLVGIRSFPDQALFQPADRGRHLGILVAQPLDELDDEAVGQRRLRS